MLTSETFAKAILQRAEEQKLHVDHLKLQKLSYYCQGYHLALFDEAAFEGKVKAWEHGPVVQEMYPVYRPFGSATINIVADQNYFAQASETVQHVIDWVLEFYGKIGSWSLRNMTHQEDPWQNHYDQSNRRVDQQEISHDELKNFFKAELINIQDSYFASVLDSLNSEVIEIPETIHSEEQFYAWIMDDSQSHDHKKV